MFLVFTVVDAEEDGRKKKSLASSCQSIKFLAERERVLLLNQNLDGRDSLVSHRMLNHQNVNLNELTESRSRVCWIDFKRAYEFRQRERETEQQ